MLLPMPVLAVGIVMLEASEVKRLHLRLLLQIRRLVSGCSRKAHKFPRLQRALLRFPWGGAGGEMLVFLIKKYGRGHLLFLTMK